MGEEKIHAILVLEILGRPPEHIKATLVEIVDKMGKEKNVKVINKTIAEPKPVKEEENVFTSFAEIEIETELAQLLSLIFGYMPSHIDIITPENLRIKNFDLNFFLNELVRRLHQYDELAKAMMIERQMIAKQIQEGKIQAVQGEKKEKEGKEVKAGKKQKDSIEGKAGKKNKAGEKRKKKKA